MLRQYRIERVQGIEFVVQETFRNYTWTKDEFDRFAKQVSAMDNVQDVELARAQFRIDNEIPVYEQFPCVVVRGAVADNRVVEFYASCDSVVNRPLFQSEIDRFFGVFDSKHWRNMIACQRDNYGSLFGSDNDSESGKER